jgi:hypothetical protein
MRAPGQADATVGYEAQRDPPGSVTENGCRRDPVVTGWMRILDSDDDDRPGLFHQLFGEAMVLGLTLMPGAEFAAPGRFIDAVGDPLAPHVLHAIAAGLLGEDRAGRVSAAHLAEELADRYWQQPDALLPVVPYVIWALAEEDGWEVDNMGEMDDGTGDIPVVRHALGTALEEISNEEIAYRADLWWDWWQQQ